MLTAGDVQFEPPQSKIAPITNSIVAMLAGDSSLQSEIMSHVLPYVVNKIKDNKNLGRWLEVREIAYVYRDYFNFIKNLKAENDILSPLFLDRQSFSAQQKNMSPDLIKQIATELINFKMPQIATIIAGVDENGPHLYTIEDGKVNCLDGVGFVSIGSGSWHANSQLMFVGHCKQHPFAETLLLTFSAKKRAEVAPGVGSETDMFTVGPRLGSLTDISPEHIAKLKEIYEDTHNQEKSILNNAKQRASQYVQEIIDATSSISEQTTIPENDLRNTPAHGETISDEK